MYEMSILGNTLAGATGGWLENIPKKNGLDMIGNLISGAAGGNILGIIMAIMGRIADPLIDGLFNKAE